MSQKVKYLFTIILFLFSFSSYSAESVWKESYSLQAKGEYEKAIKVLVKANVSGEYALLRYAYLNYLQGNYNTAINKYKQAIKLDPASIDAKLGVTLPLLAQKRWRQVKKYTLQILQQSHWNYTAHLRLMMAEQGMRSWDDLVTHAKQLAKVYPAAATPLVYLARAYAWKGKVRNAVTIYRKVLKRIPDHIEATQYIAKNSGH